MWYCAFCGRNHTKFKKRYNFPYYKKGISRIDRKDGLCKKGIVFIELVKLLFD